VPSPLEQGLLLLLLGLGLGLASSGALLWAGVAPVQG
jgi:hypothetical protein